MIFRCRIECGRWTKISLSAASQRKLKVGSSCTFSCLNCTFFRSRDMLFNPWWSWWLLLGRRRKVSGGVDGELSVSSASAQRRLILHFFRRLSVDERRSVGGAQRYAPVHHHHLSEMNEFQKCSQLLSSKSFVSLQTCNLYYAQYTQGHVTFKMSLSSAHCSE